MNRLAVAGGLGLFLGAAGFAACSGEGALPGAGDPPPDAQTGGTGGTGGAGGGTGGAPAKKRAMLEKNPFGDVAATDNLLWDGDFEWSSPFTDQYGWLYGPPFSYAVPAAVVGPACRSGVKCLPVKDNDRILGIGVGTNAPGVEASVWVKTSPDSSGCADVGAVLTWDTMEMPEDDVQLALDPATPGPDGWCRFAGVAPARLGKLYLLVDNDTGEDMLVDDAVVRRLAEAPSGAAAVVAPVDSAMRARAREATMAARALRPADPPPSAAKEALERWTRRPRR